VQAKPSSDALARPLWKADEPHFSFCRVSTSTSASSGDQRSVRRAGMAGSGGISTGDGPASTYVQLPGAARDLPHGWAVAPLLSQCRLSVHTESHRGEVWHSIRRSLAGLQKQFRWVRFAV